MHMPDPHQLAELALHQPAWLAAVTTPAGIAIGWLARHYTLVYKLAKGALPMANFNYLGAIQAGGTLLQGLMKEQQIQHNPDLNVEQKAEQIVELAAADVPVLVAPFCRIPEAVESMLTPTIEQDLGKAIGTLVELGEDIAKAHEAKQAAATPAA